MISIIIPTYTAVDYLDLCLESIYKNQHYSNNEIVIVVDGTYDICKHIIEKFKDKLNINPVIFEENQGFATATNYGMYNASNNLCLNVNDDNVFPKDFDKILIDDYNHFSTSLSKKVVIVPNQIEPRPSIFKSFIIKNYGETFDEFDLEKFTKEEIQLRSNFAGSQGWTYPFFCSKDTYNMVGGLDVQYNCAQVVDWDLFVKWDKCGVSNIRTFRCNFYHFGSKSARPPESVQKEYNAHQFFTYKWGFPAYNRAL